MNKSVQDRRKQFFRTLLTIIGLALLALPTIFCGTAAPAVDVEATVAAGIAATQQAEANLKATIDAAVAATQQAAPERGRGDEPVGPTVTASILSPSPAIPDPQQARNVILTEVNGTVAQDLSLLRSLYTPDAIIVDRNGTPDDPSDDTTWRGLANIERRYQAFFSSGVSSLTLVDLSIQVNGDQAIGTHQGVVLDGTLYPDQGVYTLEKIGGRWLITQLEYGNQSGYVPFPAEGESERRPTRDDGLYVLEIGNQHRYEEPWGWDQGDPCKAWETGNFDDTKPYYRGFNVELLLTNNSDTKVPDAWPITFTTRKGKSVQACYYGYEGSGPQPGATSSVTFFTVVEKGDYVEKITFGLENQTIQICLDGKGGWSRC